MRLEPDFQAAADEQRVVATLARTALSRAGVPVPNYDALCFPGLIAVAHDVQRLPADATTDQLAACMAAGRAALAAGIRQLTCCAMRPTSMSKRSLVPSMVSTATSTPRWTTASMNALVSLSTAFTANAPNRLWTSSLV